MRMILLKVWGIIMNILSNKNSRMNLMIKSNNLLISNLIEFFRLKIVIIIERKNFFFVKIGTFIPTSETICNFCKNIVISTKMEKEVLVICLIYIERL